MNDFETQLKNIIINNTPKNFDIMLPINEETEQKTILYQIYEIVKDTNEKVRETNFIVKKIFSEIEQERIEKLYRG